MDLPWIHSDWDALIPEAGETLTSNSQLGPPQLEPQSDNMFSPVGMHTEIRKYTKKDWEAYKPEITRLYESNTLDTVIKVMRERHGLDAT